MTADAIIETFGITTGLVLSPLSSDLTDLCPSLLADLGDDPELHLFSLHLYFHAEEIHMQRQCSGKLVCKCLRKNHLPHPSQSAF